MDKWILETEIKRQTEVNKNCGQREQATNTHFAATKRQMVIAVAALLVFACWEESKHKSTTVFGRRLSSGRRPTWVNEKNELSVFTLWQFASTSQIHRATLQKMSGKGHCNSRFYLKRQQFESRWLRILKAFIITVWLPNWTRLDLGLKTLTGKFNQS